MVPPSCTKLLVRNTGTPKIFAVEQGGRAQKYFGEVYSSGFWQSSPDAGKMSSLRPEGQQRTLVYKFQTDVDSKQDHKAAKFEMVYAHQILEGQYFFTKEKFTYEELLGLDPLKTQTYEKINTAKSHYQSYIALVQGESKVRLKDYSASRKIPVGENETLFGLGFNPAPGKIEVIRKRYLFRSTDSKVHYILSKQDPEQSIVINLAIPSSSSLGPINVRIKPKNKLKEISKSGYTRLNRSYLVKNNSEDRLIFDPVRSASYRWFTLPLKVFSDVKGEYLLELDLGLIKGAYLSLSKEFQRLRLKMCQVVFL